MGSEHALISGLGVFASHTGNDYAAESLRQLCSLIQCSSSATGYSLNCRDCSLSSIVAIADDRLGSRPDSIATSRSADCGRPAIAFMFLPTRSWRALRRQRDHVHWRRDKPGRTIAFAEMDALQQVWIYTSDATRVRGFF